VNKPKVTVIRGQNPKKKVPPIDNSNFALGIKPCQASKKIENYIFFGLIYAINLKHIRETWKKK
jgi:hypothetical protein